MKYNDYIILTDEDYNNMKSKYHHLDDIDRDKLLDIYDQLVLEYRELESSADTRLGSMLSMSKSQIATMEDMFQDAGIDYSGRGVESASVESEHKSPYYSPLKRLFMLGRPMPPPRPPHRPYRRGLDIVDLMLMYMLLRPHSRFMPSICSMAHDRVECLKSVGEYM